MRNVFSGGFRISFLSIPQIVAHGQYFDPHLFICFFFIFHFLYASFCLFFCLFVLANSNIYLIKRMLLKFGRDFKNIFLSKPTLFSGKKVNNNCFYMCFINFIIIISIFIVTIIIINNVLFYYLLLLLLFALLFYIT